MIFFIPFDSTKSTDLSDCFKDNFSPFFQITHTAATPVATKPSSATDFQVA
tara:strand:- start:311 stop:463 length:153 start_codon:yes stop_codon:yes gene_type:complete